MTCRLVAIHPSARTTKPVPSVRAVRIVTTDGSDARGDVGRGEDARDVHLRRRRRGGTRRGDGTRAGGGAGDAAHPGKLRNPATHAIRESRASGRGDSRDENVERTRIALRV